MSFGEDRARYGWLGALKGFVFRLLERWLDIQVNVVQTRPLEADYRLPTTLSEQFTFRRLTCEEALAAAADPAMALSPDFVRTALARGDLGLAAFAGDRVVSYIWCSTSELAFLPGIRARITGAGLCCHYKSFIHRDFRGQRLNSAISRFWDANCRAMGLERSVTYMSQHNLPSLRALHRAGVWKRIGYLVVFNRRQGAGPARIWRSPGVRCVLAFDAA